MKYIIGILFFLTTPAWADQMVFSFRNPQFGGDGYSSHVLTIENEEYTRKQSVNAAQKAKADQAAAAAANTNLAKFMNNLESRIYAQLSLQLSNAMFSDGSTTGSVNFQGSTINWIKDLSTQTINLTIVDPNQNKTEITVPIGSFKF
jgi:hypothetical protein